MLVDIDSDYWDLPVLREAIAAQVWGAPSDGSRHRREPSVHEVERVPVAGPSGLPASTVGAVPAARSGGGRHRRPTPVG